MQMSKVHLIGVLLLVSAAPGCRKSEPGGVPPVAVDISININNPAYNALAVPSGWLYLSGGSQGLIVYRNGRANSPPWTGTALTKQATCAACTWTAAK